MKQKYNNRLTDEKTGSVAVGQEVVVLLAGVGDGFQLQGRQLAFVDGRAGQVELVPDLRGFDARHTGGLDDRVGVRLADLRKQVRLVWELVRKYGSFALTRFEP